MHRLRGKRIWLTGASQGIGEALALELGRAGAALALTARRADVLQALCDRLKGKGIKAISLPGDATDLEAMKRIAASIEVEWGGIDILVANAGTHLDTHPEEFSCSEYLSIMDLNFGGMVRCIEAVIPGMLRRSTGQIVGMASLAGFRGLPRAAAYGASKAAVIHFLESIRFHLRRRGISVTIVNPGFVKTPLTDKNDFRMPFLMEADRAAAIICRGIAAEKREIAFPAPFSWALKLMRILPFRIYEAIIERLWK